MRPEARKGRFPCVAPWLAGGALVLALAACDKPPFGHASSQSGKAAAPAGAAAPAPAPVTQSGGSAPVGAAAPRVSGTITPAPTTPAPPARITFGSNPTPVQLPPAGSAVPAGPADITLNYVNADLREVIRVILGNLLKANYTVDPLVNGTVTLQTSQAIPRTRLLGLLQELLAENGATLVESGGYYHVLPAARAGGAAGAGAAAAAVGGTEVVPLRYTAAKDVARALQPYVGEGRRLTPAPSGNALVISGTAAERESLVALIRSFDVEALAGRSYGIFPVKSDSPEKVASELQDIIDADNELGGEGAVHVVPIERINAVLVVSRKPAYLTRIQRLLDEIDKVGGTSARKLHVYYVQNGTAGDLAPLLQRAFAPSRAGATGGEGETQQNPLSPGTQAATIATPAQGQGVQAQGQQGLGQQQPVAGAQPAGGTGSMGGAQAGQLGGTGSLARRSGTGETEGESEVTAMPPGIRIIPDKRNNALLISATDDEYAMIEATLRKIDILPLQVLIEATIAEVTLNDALQYGTQWFFAKGKGSVGLINTTAGQPVEPVNPGFNFAITGAVVQTALSALESVTTVKVISDPQLLVLDNEYARLQVGDLVPIVTQSAVSVTTSGAPIVNNVDYRETGVILEVAPRVNSGNLVTLDIQQEVSDVVPTTTSTINSPTIEQRKIKTRVVVQDGETIALGGLIKDNTSVANSGFPWLTDIPVLGGLFGTRSVSAQRTELLVLLTPHVIHDQRDVRALTDELRQRLGGLASQPLPHDPIEPPGPLRTPKTP